VLGPFDLKTQRVIPTSPFVTTPRNSPKCRLSELTSLQPDILNRLAKKIIMAMISQKTDRDLEAKSSHMISSPTTKGSTPPFLRNTPIDFSVVESHSRVSRGQASCPPGRFPGSGRACFNPSTRRRCQGVSEEIGRRASRPDESAPKNDVHRERSLEGVRSVRARCSRNSLLVTFLRNGFVSRKYRYCQREESGNFALGWSYRGRTALQIIGNAADVVCANL